MLACQLRKERAYHLDNFHMPSSLILEALMILRCYEVFCSEHLEMLGEVNCHIFLKYPQKHDGKLN